MRCKVLLNFKLFESYIEDIEAMIFQHKGLVYLPSKDDDDSYVCFPNYKLANLFFKDLFFYVVYNNLAISVVNEKPYDFHPKDHTKPAIVKLITNPNRVKRGPEFTLKYYIDSKEAGLATYLCKSRDLICPPFQIKRSNNYVEQQVYVKSLHEMIALLNFFKAKFGKKFIVYSIDYQ